MPPSETANIQTRLDKATAIVRVFHERVFMSLPVQLILLLTGIASIGYGQYLMEKRLPQSIPNFDAEFWNTVYRLEIANYHNVYFGLRYFLIGMFLCVLTIVPLTWNNPLPQGNVQFPSQEGRGRRILTMVVGVFLMVFLLTQLGRHLYSPIYLFYWLIAILAFTRFWWECDKRIRDDLSLGISYIDLLCITGLLLLGFIVGSFALQDIPIAILLDEDQFWHTAAAIARNQIDPVIFDTGVFTFPIASSIVQSWLLRTFGINLWAWRFSSVIMGVFVVLPLYLLAKEWFSRGLAIVTCILMIGNPYYISFCRLGYNNSQALLPVVFCIYFFVLSVRKSSYFYLWLAGLAAGIGFYTYSASWLGLFILLAGSLYLRFLKIFNWKSLLTAMSIILFGWAIVFVPRIVYLTSGGQHESLVYRLFEASFANVFYGQAYYGQADLVHTMPLIQIGEHHRLFYDPVIYAELIYRGTVRTFLAFFDPYLVQNHFLVAGLAGAITPVFLLMGLVVCLRYRKELHFALILIWFLGGTISLSVLSAFPPAQTHLVSIIPALALISAIGLFSVMESLTRLLFSRQAIAREVIRNGGIAAACLVIVVFGLRAYFITMPATYPPSFEIIAFWISGKIEIPVHLIYVGQPEKAYRLEKFMNTAGMPHEYRGILPEEFSPPTGLPDTPTVIFIESQKGQGTPWLRTQLAGYHQPVPYNDKDGKLIGYAMANIDVDLEPRIGFDVGLRSLVEKPVRFVLILLVFALILFGYLTFRHRGSARVDQ